MTGAPRSKLASILAAFGATAKSAGDRGAELQQSELAPVPAMRGKKSKRPRRWHEGRAAVILAGSGKVGYDRQVWFRHLAYGDARPNTPHPNPKVAARQEADIAQIIAGRRQRDIERRERNERRQGLR